ncbi:CCA tRNA nucleotidyltransferase [Telmatospirillum sp. J64-1]|uniref:CCA tRNA nucleotidyltransferase n=1 Tax=Telmatospirillum sp. J64-1 TaxID=2502183 RepID=UPI00115C695D|nr:CCA tRNA nucleotidyltransferase [Telmatospirillum sp. J64-1]
MTAAMTEPVGQLEPQAWMTAPETRAVVAALTAEGAEVRFVGGCVRDAVLKRPIKDIDIATHDPPERVIALLEKAGIHAIPTGIEHGTVTAVTNGMHFEVTTLRCDVETFGRKARVAFTDDWVQDAARRDLTINALFCTPTGEIYDPFDGLADLGAGRVRFVGNPMKRIEEDVLRLLRFFRFFAHYGRPPLDREALQACRLMAHHLPSLSGERICGELIKLLLAPDPVSVLLVMQGEKILPHILPEAAEFGRLRQLVFLERRGLVLESVRPDPIRRLACLVSTNAEGAAAIAARLRLSNAQTRRLIALAAPVLVPDPAMTAVERRRALHRIGAEDFRDLALIAWAGRRAVSDRPRATEADAWRSLLEAADAWQPVEFPLKGRDILALGIPPGPRVGEMLGAIERWWEEGDFRAGREDCLARLREMAGS